ncbi:MAG: histidine--tRNA ligase [Bacteroidetes bacterium]|nr:MAG: histidine--tRNA ligase [Bacteroidota bacterium]
MSKPSIPKGTRDFGPRAMARRQWIFATIREVFKRHGFLPVETPSFENLQTLTGKYGEEGDKLIFRILNNGDYLSKADPSILASKDTKALTPTICKKALRYDLTVPFARFVVMNRNELTFPFRRYQIQPVWRGDRPGKGRYQEFTQCDADIIGSTSTLCEFDLVQIVSEALTSLGIPGYTILINDRRILAAVASSMGVTPERLTDWTVAVDKYDKVGIEGVVKELEVRGFDKKVENGIEKLFEINSASTSDEVLSLLEKMIASDEQGLIGLAEMKKLLYRSANDGIIEPNIRFDAMLARGLDYYTGAIFEVRVENSPVGSICGGGRYDDLTGIFGWSGMSGVGISFGADRIEDVLEYLDIFPKNIDLTTDVLVTYMDEDNCDLELQIVTQLRNDGFAVEMYPEAVKLKKQMKYAGDRSIPYVILIGEEERSTGKVTLKNMDDGSQTLVDPLQISSFLS